MRKINKLESLGNNGIYENLTLWGIYSPKDMFSIDFIGEHIMNTSSQQPKFDIYQNVTDRIVKALETGTVPWLKPWSSPDCNLSLPRNAVSDRYYNGVNILLLWMANEENGYKQSKWITAEAANKLGGRIRKGEKATVIVNYCPIEREKLDEDGNQIVDDDGNIEMEHFAYLKKHCVFNIEQCESLPKILYEAVSDSKPESNSMPYQEFAEIRQIMEGIEVQVNVKPSNRAFYNPNEDIIVMPEMKQFTNEQGFYEVLLHEMIHSTGHKTRLNREGIASGKSKFGNKVYAFEELVAEMGAAFLCSHLGFNTVPKNASYIASWIKLLKEDKKAIFKAAGKAREACQYMFETLQVVQQYERFNYEA